MSLQHKITEIIEFRERLETLRPTPARIARVEDLSKGNPVEENNDNEQDIIIRDFLGFEFEIESDSESEIDTMASQLPITNKFVGRIEDPNDPDKDRLESFTVDKFLNEVDARITSKKLTQDADKIKEAHLLVSTEKGDANFVIFSSMFSKLTTYAQFKEKCKSIWQPGDHKDQFYNLLQLRNVKKVGTDHHYTVDLHHAVDRVVSDIVANPHITVHPGGPRNQLVDLEQVISYISYGTMYANLPEEYKVAFRKVPLDPTKDHLDILNEIKGKITAEKVLSDNETALFTQSKVREKVVPIQNKSSKTNTSSPPRSSTNRGRNSSNQVQYSNQSQYRNNASTRNYQGSNYSSGTYRSSYGRGRDNWSYSNNSWNECRKCGRTNHRTVDCICCDYCLIPGHYVSECYSRKRDLATKKGPMQNKNQNKNQDQNQSK